MHCEKIPCYHYGSIRREEDAKRLRSIDGGSMTDQELRRLSRAQLLEILLEQMEENRKLKERLEEARAELANRQILMKETGSLKEAAKRLNALFETADRVAKNRKPESMGV